MEFISRYNEISVDGVKLNWGANPAFSTQTFDTSKYSSGPLVVVNQNGSGVETGLKITEIVFLKTVQ